MKKNLFVTTKNILNTCGELRLIKNRAEALHCDWNIATDFIVVCEHRKIRSSNEHIDSNGNLVSLGFNINNPFEIFSAFNRCKNMIKKKIKQNNYQCVVLSGVGMLHYSKLIRKLDSSISIIFDVHGASEDLLFFVKNKGFVKKTIFSFINSIDQFIEKRNYSKVDGVFVVSNALEKYMRKKHPKCTKILYYIVPCSTDKSSNLLSKIEIKDNRIKYRNKYNIEDEEKLFIYSGGVSAWQCIEATIELFRDIKKSSSAKCKMLILSHQIDKIIPLLKEDDKIITDKALPSEVNKVICAGDFAFLLRDNVLTNNVAFPNKFIEYVKSGMEIITTPYVYDIADMVKKYQLGVIIDYNDKNNEILYEHISSKYESDFENRLSLLNHISFNNTLRKFVQDTMEKK